MSDTAIKNLIILGGGILLLGALLLERPGYLASPDLLGTLIVAELVLAAVCNYRQVFFPVVLGAFLWAGVGVPLASAWVMGRWFVLLIAALAGFAIYIKDRNHYFSAIHLVALFCVISAVISAVVSAYPEEALLKAMSLLLLILYGASGVRLAVPVGRPEIFFGWLLRGCEVLTYLSAISYFALRWEIFGNPNSLGAVMGVAVVPTLLWGFVSAETTVAKRRLGFELVLALLLLLSSFARAGIAAGAIASIILCVTLRQYRLLIKGIAASAALAVAVVMFVPQSESSPKWDSWSFGASAVGLAKMMSSRKCASSGCTTVSSPIWKKPPGAFSDIYEKSSAPMTGAFARTKAACADLSALIAVDAHTGRIVRSRRNCRMSVANCSGAVIFAKASATEPTVIAKGEAGMRRRILGIEFDCSRQQWNGNNCLPDISRRCETRAPNVRFDPLVVKI
jgi:hypothetical protein